MYIDVFYIYICIYLYIYIDVYIYMFVMYDISLYLETLVIYTSYIFIYRLIPKGVYQGKHLIACHCCYGYAPPCSSTQYRFFTIAASIMKSSTLPLLAISVKQGAAGWVGFSA